MPAYTPRTGAKCSCKRGIQRDNCPTCEGTGWAIDWAAIHATFCRCCGFPAHACLNRSRATAPTPPTPSEAPDHA